MDAFLAGMKPGRSEDGGQDLLKRAFRAYARAADITLSLEERRRACYFGNCLAIYHEHIRLQPVIAGSMPWIIRRCVTQRIMHYDVGALRLSVSDEFPNVAPLAAVEVSPSGELREFLEQLGWDGAEPVAASDWTSLRQRMRYVVELFRRYHLDANVRSAPLANDSV